MVTLAEILRVKVLRMYQEYQEGIKTWLVKVVAPPSQPIHVPMAALDDICMCGYSSLGY